MSNNNNAVNNRQSKRATTNCGSILLTVQENEALYSYLGKKCVVSECRGPSWREGGMTGGVVRTFSCTIGVYIALSPL